MKKLVIGLFLALSILIPNFIDLENSNHSGQAIAETVVFNPKSHKMHKPSCASAKRCKTCITTSSSDAINQGGIPCKMCMNKK